MPEWDVAAARPPQPRSTAMMAMIRDDLAALGVVHDGLLFPSARCRMSRAAIPMRCGETIEDLRARAISSMRAGCRRPRARRTRTGRIASRRCSAPRKFGDDVDRPLLKSDGSYTYFANDIAYHRSKFVRGFAEMIDVWGADHGGYVKRMHRGGEGGDERRGGARRQALPARSSLLRNGEQVKMSKRSGDFVTLREVIDEVGRDAVRFMMIFRKNDATLDFDLAKVVEQSKDNPVFYVQYAHARCAFDLPAGALRPSRISTFRRRRWRRPISVMLTDEAEIGILKMIAAYPSDDRRCGFGTRAASRGLLRARARKRLPFALEQGQRLAAITVR
jgi:arginyl-tRNA synthetase